MLNPDGVVLGNYRCSMAGLDLNRRWRDPSATITPSIFYLKKLLRDIHTQGERTNKKSEIVFYCDIHGHSKATDTFMYGCYDTDLETGERTAAERLMPHFISKREAKFSFLKSKYHVGASKEGTGRVVGWRCLKLISCYTLEASLAGGKLGMSMGEPPVEDVEVQGTMKTPDSTARGCLGKDVENEESNMCIHYSTVDLKGIGANMCKALLDYGEAKEKNPGLLLELQQELIKSGTIGYGDGGDRGEDENEAGGAGAESATDSGSDSEPEAGSLTAAELQDRWGEILEVREALEEREEKEIISNKSKKVRSSSMKLSKDLMRDRIRSRQSKTSGGSLHLALTLDPNS